MKLKFDVTGKTQPDPFIFQDGDRFYIYVTARNGVEVYETDDIFGTWIYKGVATAFSNGGVNYWAPSVIKVEGRYYMYTSCNVGDAFEHLYVAQSDSPLGPFQDEKELYDRFSIDSHVVQTEAGLFLYYARDEEYADPPGTRICIDRLTDPYTVENDSVEVVLPSFEEERHPQCRPSGNWFTIEGPTWFTEGEWQYLMYSAASFENDTYHVGYCAAKTTEPDLKKVKFEKVTRDGRFNPVLIKNEFEEGTGHHSVMKHNGVYYAIYHARDYDNRDKKERYLEARTARICKLNVEDGVITAERYEDHI